MSESPEQRRPTCRTHRVYSRTFKHQVVRETLAPGATVSSVARHHDLSMNVVFEWRRLHRLGLLPAPVDEAHPELLPVQVVDEAAAGVSLDDAASATHQACNIEIELGERRIRVTGLSTASVERLLLAWLG